jgi:hypothetical protein
MIGRLVITSARRACWAVAPFAMVGVWLVGPAQADPDGQMYGDPAAAAPYWRYQHREDCGLMAVADVVGQVTGHEPPQGGIQLRGLLTKSTNHAGAVYRFDGTSPEDLVVLLQQFGIRSQLSSDNTIQSIEQDLTTGHKVIATLNAEAIWNSASAADRGTADHAVVITGVDTRNDIVHLNDSGISTGRDEQIPLPTFMQSWATGRNQLIVTDTLPTTA